MFKAIGTLTCIRCLIALVQISDPQNVLYQGHPENLFKYRFLGPNRMQSDGLSRDAKASVWSVVLTSILIGSADIIISKRLEKKN